MAVRTHATATHSGVSRKRDLLPYMLAIPIILYEGFFILVPMVQQFFSSFTSDVIGFGAVKFVGLANYDRMWHDARFWNSLRVTFTFMISTVIVAVGLGLLAAILMNQKFRGRSIARTLITVPWAFPDIPTVIVFFWILNPSFGVINIFARFLMPWLTENPKWLQDINLAMPIVVAIASWKAFPFYGLVTLSAMQAIPDELYDAAKVDGADSMQSFRFVTLPEIIPTLMLLGVLAAIFSFRQFALIFLTTGGGPGRVTETLVVQVYKTAFTSFDFSYGATLGVAGFVAVFCITLIFAVLQRRQEAEAQS